jgi:hypothetical protein
MRNPKNDLKTEKTLAILGVFQAFLAPLGKVFYDEAHTDTPRLKTTVSIKIMKEGVFLL